MISSAALITFSVSIDGNSLGFRVARHRETWDGLRTFPGREFGVLLGELLPFAA